LSKTHAPVSRMSGRRDLRKLHIMWSIFVLLLCKTQTPVSIISINSVGVRKFSTSTDYCQIKTNTQFSFVICESNVCGIRGRPKQKTPAVFDECFILFQFTCNYWRRNNVIISDLWNAFPLGFFPSIKTA